MKTPLRLSPIHDSLQSLNGAWRDINGMPSLVTLPGDRQSASVLGIADLSFLTRFGVKGANAAEWLADRGLPIPDRPNTWHSLPAGGIVARLGLTEFLIEDSLNSAISPQLATTCKSPPAKVYPVLRQDLALGLVGDRVNDLLRQTCSFNFQALSLSDRPVVLTNAIGVAVTVIPSDGDYYRIWCDRTFGTYFWQTLIQIATELGGGAIGTESFL
ncbi:methylglutamate dehydrogenase [Scytonema millei]|uniref:Methylglutamate dehydrogenase n=1 Tax=Scytonema millei VB511283 TaxID=1245923 RepID=A0A9X5EA09_9CYAN|nr:methylglutamate dehydrogenase [Scytonema millei]NHC38065.1 methylglutamate dehydrogenase [Scytonema millei VB511283]